jgi:Uma2 family endonuclease
MKSAQATPRRYSAEEYLALEEVSEVRHEFYRGEIFAKSGGIGFHNIVKQNCVISLRLALRGKGCRVYDEDVRLAVLAGELYTYPDVMVTCHPDDSPDKPTMHHPLLLIEVLSPSTESRDRVWKFNRYTRLPSLQHYLLGVSQYVAGRMVPPRALRRVVLLAARRCQQFGGVTGTEYCPHAG